MLRTRIMIIVTSVSIFAGTIHASNCHSGSGTTTSGNTTKSEKEIATKPVQTKCPVMGNTVDRSFSIEWKDERDSTLKRIYFCCEPCIETFKSNPVKYIKKLEKMKQPIEIVNTK